MEFTEREIKLLIEGLEWLEEECTLNESEWKELNELTEKLREETIKIDRLH